MCYHTRVPKTEGPSRLVSWLELCSMDELEMDDACVIVVPKEDPIGRTFTPWWCLW
jgi:hypothetical protein